MGVRVKVGEWRFALVNSSCTSRVYGKAHRAHEKPDHRYWGGAQCPRDCRIPRARWLCVRVLERRPFVGGAVLTRELWPGYQVDTCSSFHVLIHLTGIVEELGLAKYGLTYQHCDPFAFAPFPDGTSLRFFKDVDRTCNEIARFSARDAETYRAFVALWTQFNEAVFAAFNAPPSPEYMLPAIHQARRAGFAEATTTGAQRHAAANRTPAIWRAP